MTKITEISLELAAQCWCDEDTSSIEMDSHLAIAFAKRLDDKDKQIAELDKTNNQLEGRIAELEDLAQMIIDADSADERLRPMMYHVWLFKAKALK
jgi:hypothetical protein